MRLRRFRVVESVLMPPPGSEPVCGFSRVVPCLTGSREREAAWASIDGRDIGTDQFCGLLVDASLSAIGVIFLKMRKGSSRSYRVHLVVAVGVERNVHKGIDRR